MKQTWTHSAAPATDVYRRVTDAIVESGRHGQKTSAGLYKYAEGERRPIPDPEIEAMFAKAGAEMGIANRKPTAEEIVELSRSRQANLIVMGLHSSGLLGPRMGSVTYRVLSMTDAFVLALPPHVAIPAVQPMVAQRAMA